MCCFEFSAYSAVLHSHSGCRSSRRHESRFHNLHCNSKASMSKTEVYRGWFLSATQKSQRKGGSMCMILNTQSNTIATVIIYTLMIFGCSIRLDIGWYHLVSLRFSLSISCTCRAWAAMELLGSDIRAACMSFETHLIAIVGEEIHEEKH